MSTVSVHQEAGIAVTVPRLGWSMEEGTFVDWLKPDGANVAQGDPLFALESEKATQDIEAIDAGILRILPPPQGPTQGDIVKVGQVIGYVIPRSDAKIAPVPAASTPPVAARSSAPSIPRSQAQEPTSSPRQSQIGSVASPRARRVAQELGVDWTTLDGSGRDGRVRERDVRAVKPVAAVASVSPPPPSAGDDSLGGTTIPITPARRAIADRMIASLRATAPVTLTAQADVEHLTNMRAQFQEAAKLATESTPVPSLTDFLVKLTARALATHPLLHARWSGETIVMAQGVHIGVAVDTEAGLFVPVIRDVQNLSLKQISARSRELIAKARARRLSSNESQGASFTITNLGMFGIDAFTPIINAPETAILGVGAVRREPTIQGPEDRVVPRHRMTLSLTFDHRVVDGAPAARFLQTLRQAIENPAPWLID